MIPVTERVEQYLAQRETFGTGLSDSPVRELRTFAAFVSSEGAEHVTTELFLRWKVQRPGAASRLTWSCRLSHVRAFARWLQSLEPRTEVPPPGLIPKSRRRPQPYIYTDEEVADIVTRAARLPSRHGLRGRTCETLFGLLAVTGLRVGEALALDDVDVDTDEALLHVRHAKNNRNRTVPVTPCTAERLACYRSLRDRILRAPETPAFFRGERGQRITKASAEHNFARVGQETGLRERQSCGRRGTGPRLHDLRHTMAVRTLVDWYRSGLDPDREMYKLSAWLGHASPVETYWYLEAVPELLHLATERAERSITGGKRDDSL